MAPAKADDLEAVRVRRAELAEILKHPSLLTPAAEAEFAKQYAETGAILEAAAAKAGDK